MATGKTKEVGIRLTVQEKEIVERALKDLGREGHAALRKIEDAGRSASSSLLAVNAAAGVGKSAFFGLASGALAAVASILSVSAVINATTDALDRMSEIADRAKSTGLDVELFQEVAHHAELAGVGYDEFSSSLETFIRNAGLAEVGKGKMVSALKALNPELLRNIQLATSQQERLKLAADAINEAGSASEKAALATALFGANGARMVEVFNGGAAALEATAQKARELGIIVDRELIARAEELGDEFETASKVIDINLKSALVSLAPTMVWLVERAGDLAKAFNIVIDQFKDVEDRTFVRPLQNQLAELYNKRSAVGDEISTIRTEAAPGQASLTKTLVADKQAEYDQMTADADRLLSRITELQGRGRTEVVPPVTEIPDLPAGEAAKKAIGEAEQLMQRLRTASEAYAETLAKLEHMRASGLITQETQNRGIAEAVLKLASASKLTADYTAAQQALDAALQRGIISETEYTDAVEGMTKRRLEASNTWVDGVQLGLARIAERSGNLGDDIADSLVSGVDRFEDAWISALETGEFKWQDLAKQILLDLARMSTRNLITGPISNFLGGLFKPNALGNVYSGPGINAYSNTVVDRPTFFPFAAGTGLMGEAGPEAIIPLRRGPDGRLGVGGGGSAIHLVLEVINNISAANLSPDQMMAVLEQNNKSMIAQIVPTVRKAMGQGQI